MITLETLKKSARPNITEINREFIIGVDTAPNKAIITLGSIRLIDSGPKTRFHIRNVFEASLDLTLEDLPGLVEYYNVNTLVVDIGPERVWAEKLIESVDCNAFLCNYTKNSPKSSHDNILNIERNNALDLVFDTFNEDSISVNSDFEDKFPANWANQLTNVERAYFDGKTKYITTGSDNFFHSLVYAMLAAKYKS